MTKSLRWSEQAHAEWRAREAARSAAEVSTPPAIPSCVSPSHACAGGRGPDFMERVEQQRQREQSRAKAFRLTHPEPPEAAVLAAVLKALRLHPKVAAAWRVNSGAFRVGEPGNERWFRAGFVGCPDINGLLHDGRFLAVECKRPSGRPTPEQTAFLELVNSAGGVAFVARRVSDVIEALA